MKNKIYIAGAHSRGQTFRTYIEKLNPDIQVAAYLVDDLGGNELYIDGVPVFQINPTICKDYPVYLATRGVYHKKLTRELKSLGVQKVIPVTVEFDMELRNRYVKEVFKENGRDFKKIDDFELPASTEAMGLEACIYVANSIYDRPLQRKYKLTADERIIQVGAALTDKRIFDDVLTDCEGDNISAKNRQYCELTGLYWIWKNAKEDYLGLVHYRRHFLLPDNWVQRVEQNHIDVILPVPLYVGPNLEDNFKSRHIPSDWEYLMKYFKEKFPDEYDFAQDVFHGNLYSPCNMFIMRKEVLNDLCSWMFPILDEVAEHGGEKEDVYMNRYPGFISERLITYFFERYREKYKIVYANKNFLM